MSTLDDFDFELVLYAVRGKDGKWYKSRGQSGSGPRWVDGVNLAKIYTKPGPAKAVITWWSKNFPNFGTPDLVEITAREVKVIDQEDRVKEQKQKEKEASARRIVRNKEALLKFAKEKLKAAEEELDRLKKVEKNNKPLESKVLKSKLKYAKRDLEDAQEELDNDS